MASKRTAKSCYQSGYGGEWVSASQRLVELICERIAGSKGQSALTPFFWREPGWEKLFRQQITQANRLIQAYSYEAVFRALQRKEAWKVYSFGAPWFKDLVAEEQEKIKVEDAMRANAYVPEAGDVNSRPREQRKNNKSLRSKLDNGKTKEGGEAPR